MAAESPKPEALLPSRAAERIIGIGRTAAAERRNPRSKYYDPDFPQPIQLAGSNSVRYVESEVYAYVHKKIQAARATAATKTPRGVSRRAADVYKLIRQSEK